MMKLCSMASLGNQSGCVVSKDCVSLLPTSGVGRDITRSDSLNLRPRQYEELWKPINGLSESNSFVKIDSTVRKLALINMQGLKHSCDLIFPYTVQDVSPSSLLFSYGIAEKYTRHKKMLQYLMSGSSELEKEGLDLSLLSELMEFQTISRDGRVLFTGTGSEMKDLLSVVTEFYSAKDLTVSGKQSLLVPYFNRLEGSESLALADLSSLKLEALTVAPLKSPKKTKLNPSHRKRKNSRKQSQERDLYRKNSFHACESLLSLMVDRRRHGKAEMHSLKKSSPELPTLLTQFSAGIAGTGLAVLFSVICKVACGSLPLSATKLLNTGFGVGLVWLAAAVNGLRDGIIRASKNSNKMGVKEEEVMQRVDMSVKEIYFRAATVMAFAVLRLA